MPPLIGISGYRTDIETDDLQVPHMATQVAYVRAVLKAGGTPVVIPELEPDAVDALLDRLDGIVIVGGPDVGPSSYGHDAGPHTEMAPPERDAFDLTLARRCVERDHPLLAICRGNQILNVALGGTLQQHIDEHMVMASYNQTVHDVTIEPGSRLAAVLGECIGTNSLHHQAIDRTGEGVRIVARAPDGTIEAIEVDGAPRTAGIQWHPELLRHRAEHLALFATLVDQAAVPR